MRLPTATLLTACALSAALVVACRGGEATNHTMPGSEVVLPAADDRPVFDGPLAGEPGPDADADGPDLDRGLDPGSYDPGSFDPDAIGPETVPEVPDPLDGGGLIPDGPDESGESGGLDALDEPDEPDRSGGPGPSVAPDRSDAVFGSPVDVARG
ncbi:hypothetical protein ABT300_25025 [Streptomyces sp. NPDC001027]|uniref:hypothetical protein n=1 Tax=Streptomyces sp. NPDC001027 TaxID=3154771 RepID=UPI00331AC82D